MAHPEIFYAAAVILFAAVEGISRVRGHIAFGNLIWVLLGVLCLSYAAYWTGLDLPASQMVIHSVALLIGFGVARGIGHFTASLFLPMALLGGLEVWGKVSPVTWWWGLFYMACAQLILVGMGANFHPLGRSLRKWAAEIHRHFNRLAGVSR